MIIKHTDLFAGIGGFRHGLEMLFGKRLKSVALCEHDVNAVRSYQAAFNTSGEEIINDLLDVSVPSTPISSYFKNKRKRNDVIKKINDHFPPCDLLTAGFPCQPHSLMGNRKGSSDSRGALIYEMIKLIDALKPKFIILENVRAFASVNQGKLFNELIYLLNSKCGYNIKTFILNAADFGVPQVRRRLFICGNLEREISPDFKSLGEVGEYDTAWHALEKNVEEKYYLSDRIKATILKNQHKGYSRPAEINRIIARPLTRTMHKMHRASQDNYYSDDFIMGNYDPITKQIIKSKLHSAERIRRITPKEAFRIQSFSSDYINRVITTSLSDTQLYMQAGNAVPPLLVKNIAAHLLNK
jgi:DNA (cytosine-5)-methyltransferase 1